MMDGRNCTGRRISLLNDSGDVTGVPAAKLPHHHHQQQQYPPPPPPQPPQHQQHPHLHHFHHHHQQPHYQHLPVQLPPLRSDRSTSTTSVRTSHSRDSSSSAASTPPSEPQTPQLIRSSSSDSRAFSTPSPLTPACNSFDHAGAASQHRAPPQQHYYLHRPAAQHPAKMDDPNDVASFYPPIPDATLPMPAAYQLAPQMPPQLPMQPSQQVTESSNSPVSEPSRVSNVSAGSNKKPTLKKNQYPCPMAKQFGCTDFFTTSGHAARHAKKHTGKKDAFCPECNKAFTRKDNMEQHRRTHQNGRGAARSSTTNNDDAKVKKSTKSSAKKSGVKAEPQQLEAAVEQQLASDAAQGLPVSSQQLPIPLAGSQVAPTPPMVPQTLQPQTVDQSLLMPQPSGPYFLNTIDTGPVPALPNTVPADLHMRPTLHRSSFASSLDYVSPLAPPLMGDGVDALHFSYPSPGLSNGLNSLALASEHRRLSEEKARESPSQETP